MQRKKVAGGAASSRSSTRAGDKEVETLPTGARCSDGGAASEVFCTAEVHSAAGEAAQVRRERCSGGDRRRQERKGREALGAREEASAEKKMQGNRTPVK
jgi:hypothetical protein